MRENVELAWRAIRRLIPELDFSAQAYKEQYEQAGQPIPETDLPVFDDDIPF